MSNLREQFKALRFDPDHHLGLGDVRLTIAQQDDLCDDYDALAARLAEALGVLKTMLVADMTRDRDLWIKTWAKVPDLTKGVSLDSSSTFVPTGAGGNASALVCCEGVGAHASGCTADSASVTQP